MDLLIVGLDGLSANMLERFDVELPVLDSVQEAGVSGDLMSVDTPTTVPAWTSFATGLDPGSHGVHSMKRISPSYEHGPARTNTSDPAIYDFLDRSIFVNLPASEGRDPAGAETMVQTSLLSASKEQSTPEPLQELDAYSEYVPLHDPTKKSRPNVYLRHVQEIVRKRGLFAREAFETYDPRVGFVLFSATDWAGHILSKLTSDAERERFYTELVTAVGTATADLADRSENVVLLSDHGFEHKDTTVHLADFLADRGDLVERDAAPDAGAGERAVDAAADAAVGTAKALSRRSDRLYGLFRLVHNRLMGTDVGARLQDAARPDVDYPASRVFNLRYGCLYVNDERFDHPRVSGDAVDELADELVAELEGLTDEDGDPLFRDVLRPDEAYADPIADVPDVIPRPTPGKFPITHWSPTGGYTSPTSNFEHRYRGLIAARGPLFDEGTVEGMSIVDVLPTVLAALGEPISPEFDGEVRTDLLAEQPDVRYLDPDELPTPRTRGETDRERSDREATVEARLADLGYME